MISFKPHGWAPDHLPLTVISRFSIDERRLVIAEYGFMMGVFDFLTGGKVCDINTMDYPGLSQQTYVKGLVVYANDLAKSNPCWIEVLESLPIIN